jgi:hypothetical protein
MIEKSWKSNYWHILKKQYKISLNVIFHEVLLIIIKVTNNLFTLDIY